MNPNQPASIRRHLIDQPNQEVRTLLRRAVLQIEFAEAFTQFLDPNGLSDWKIRIEEANSELGSVAENPSLERLRHALGQIEAVLAPIGQAAKKYSIHCVGHGHIDMNWLWSWPETVATTHDTFASVLSLMDEFDDVTYSQSQTSVYELMRKYHPSLFQQICDRIREGRWEVAAVHWVEGDKNISGGESIARHLALTRRWFAEHVSLAPDDVPVDWEPDTFGHAVTIPSFLARAGVKYYYACRTGGGHEHPRVGGVRPPVFRWVAPDGSSVLVFRETTWYNSYVNIGDNVALPMVSFCQETGLHDWMNVFGIGNHGGGPTRTEIRYLKELAEWPIYPTVRFHTVKGYFETIDAEIAGNSLQIPTIDHELNYEFTGCYTSQSLIKQANRFGEQRLLDAESLSVMAEGIGGYSASSELFEEAWRNVLFNQFHDILPGSGMRETREHATGIFHETIAISGSATRNSVSSLTASIDTSRLLPDTPDGNEERQAMESGAVNAPFEAGAGIGSRITGFSNAGYGGRRFRPVTVFNSLGWVRSEPVKLEIYDSELDPNRIIAMDESGSLIPVSFIRKGHDWGHDKVTLTFLASDVPAFGYKTFMLCEGAATEFERCQRSPNEWVETPSIRARFDRHHGGLSALCDLRNGVWHAVDHGAAGVGRWQYGHERPRGMTAWVLGDRSGPELSLVSRRFDAYGSTWNQGNGTPLKSGPVVWTNCDLEVPGTSSTVSETISVWASRPRIDFEARIDWREIGDPERGIPYLRLRFPINFDADSALCEAPFGVVRRPLGFGDDVPTLRFVHVDGKALTDNEEGLYQSTGWTLLQDCKHGHELGRDAVKMNVVRSSFDPDHAPEVAQTVVRYSLVLHDRPQQPDDLVRLAAEWNQPLIVTSTNLQLGTADTRMSFGEVAGDGIVPTCLKKALDGDGWLMRVVNYSDKASIARIRLDSSIASGKYAFETDLLEQRTTDLGSLSEGWIVLEVPAHGWKSVLIR